MSRIFKEFIPQFAVYQMGRLSLIGIFFIDFPAHYLKITAGEFETQSYRPGFLFRLAGNNGLIGFTDG